MWWRFVHERPEAAAQNGQESSAGGDPVPAPIDTSAAVRRAREDEELKAYNEYLAQLADHDRVPGTHADAAPAPKDRA
jgi:hypothetical protein